MAIKFSSYLHDNPFGAEARRLDMQARGSAVKNAALDYYNANGCGRMVCPNCMGGSSHEECLSVWDKEDGCIMATCHRAQCAVGTVLVLNGTMRPELHKVKPVPNIRQSRYGNKYIGMRIENDHAFVYPMYDASQTQRGEIIRPKVVPPGTPKALTYKDPDYNGMSWYIASGFNTTYVIVVEDCRSALRLYESKQDAISLNGTTLNADRMRDIFGVKHLMYLCLDADATNKALEYQRKWGGRYPMRVIRLMHDIKDMDAQEYTKFLSRIVST